ncbi:regulation of enolase protein 1-like [Hyposmocoma kahamanoa]|uniref:regulation of enolase protein 1-like n=1 Tax=Hyposmocoma kahamanoa TaxID=1477025 RepID=UPI000E6D6825|nr:regulation of enolase protein 1-like [Hyposmocoma kahamanoa]
MGLTKLGNITLSDFTWLNKPSKWKITNNVLHVTTDNETDFWQETYYHFKHNNGHVFGVNLDQNFTFTVCVEANFTTLYDHAGLMIYLDEKHWLKSGIEYYDGQAVIGSVLTNEISDWASGEFPGNPSKFYLRLTKKDDVLCVKYSTDNKTWVLLRLAPFTKTGPCLVGLMACSPTRDGLEVKFSDIKITDNADDILRSN